MNVLDLFDLSGRVAIVTGAARGLGRQAALALAEAGADIALCDLLTPEGEQTQAMVKNLGRQAWFQQLDVTKPDGATGFVEEVLARLGRIDILINNVGIGSDGRSLEDLAPTFWNRVLETNLSSMFYVAKPVARHMIQRGEGGVIINIASMSGLIINNLAPRHNAVYCVSKAGVAHLTRGMASDWAQYQIRVNAIAPGHMVTEQTAWLRQNSEISDRLLANTPMKRFGREDELKGTVVFLASGASSFMTGHVLVVDGGYTIW